MCDKPQARCDKPHPTDDIAYMKCDKPHPADDMAYNWSKKGQATCNKPHPTSNKPNLFYLFCILSFQKQLVGEGNWQVRYSFLQLNLKIRHPFSVN